MPGGEDMAPAGSGSENCGAVGVNGVVMGEPQEVVRGVMGLEAAADPGADTGSTRTCCTVM